MGDETNPRLTLKERHQIMNRIRSDSVGDELLCKARDGFLKTSSNEHEFYSKLDRFLKEWNVTNSENPTVIEKEGIQMTEENKVRDKEITIVTLDPNDEDPVGTVEFLLSEHAKVNSHG